MKVAILHLSDLHIDKDNADWLTKKTSRIVAAVWDDFSGCGKIVISVTGDIAMAGTEEQYRLAKLFFRSLLRAFAERNLGETELENRIVCVPGNHDCNYERENKTREMLLAAMRSKPGDIDRSVYENVSSVQDEYRAFARDVMVDQAFPLGISNMISVNVICRGDLEPPVLQVPQTVSRGDWLDITIEPVENAFAYGIRISRLPDDDDSDDEMVFDGSYTEAGTIRIPTDAFEPGIYEIYAESRRYGWRGHESQYMVYVEQPDDWTDEAVFKIEKTEVLTNEQFCASVYAPGALETRFCHEDLDNWWRDGEQSISGTFSCGRPDPREVGRLQVQAQFI